MFSPTYARNSVFSINPSIKTRGIFCFASFDAKAIDSDLKIGARITPSGFRFRSEVAYF